jgi:hypothetical protein
MVCPRPHFREGVPFYHFRGGSILTIGGGPLYHFPQCGAPRRDRARVYLSQPLSISLSCRCTGCGKLFKPVGMT